MITIPRRSGVWCHFGAVCKFSMAAVDIGFQSLYLLHSYTQRNTHGTLYAYGSPEIFRPNDPADSFFAVS